MVPDFTWKECAVFVALVLEKESRWVGKSSWKELWKSQVNETNFDSVFLVKCICIWIKMFDVWNFIMRIRACVHYFCFFDQNNSWKIIENDIILSKKFLLL